VARRNVWTLTCDEPHCGRLSPTGATVAQAERKATQQGWRRTWDDRDLCSRHPGTL
jgi:hypothetical protein